MRSWIRRTARFTRTASPVSMSFSPSATMAAAWTRMSCHGYSSPFYNERDGGKARGWGWPRCTGSSTRTTALLMSKAELGKGTTFNLYFRRHTPEKEEEPGKLAIRRPSGWHRDRAPGGGSEVGAGTGEAASHGIGLHGHGRGHDRRGPPSGG